MTGPRRPALGEPDCGSWLDFSIDPHRVVRVDPSGAFHLDGEPDYDEMQRWGDARQQTLCEQHAYDMVMPLGYEPPGTVLVSYQRWDTPSPETALLRRVDGVVTHVASYAGGRAYFDSWEPRTRPCDVCGVETLRPNGEWLEANPSLGARPATDAARYTMKADPTPETS